LIFDESVRTGRKRVLKCMFQYLRPKARLQSTVSLKPIEQQQQLIKTSDH